MKRNQYEYRNIAFNVFKKEKQCELCDCNNDTRICVHHIDENPNNNNESNLQILCNSCHTTLHHKGSTTTKAKAIIQYTLDGNLIKIWRSAVDVAKDLGFSKGNINQCCNGKRKTASGYIWKFNI